MKKKFIVKYVTAEGDTTSVMVIAENREDASWIARGEYWDIEEILTIQETKK